MTVSKNQLKLFWVAARKCGFGEPQVRTALVQIAGVTSLKDLDQDGFDAMMGFWEFCGFKPLVAGGQNYGDRPGMASFAQIELVRVLWREWTKGKGDEDSLNVWLERYFKISSLRFLRADAARKVITALKSMKQRAA